MTNQEIKNNIKMEMLEQRNEILSKVSEYKEHIKNGLPTITLKDEVRARTSEKFEHLCKKHNIKNKVNANKFNENTIKELEKRLSA